MSYSLPLSTPIPLLQASPEESQILLSAAYITPPAIPKSPLEEVLGLTEPVIFQAQPWPAGLPRSSLPNLMQCSFLEEAVARHSVYHAHALSVCWAEVSLWGGSFIGLTGELSFLISESIYAGSFGKWFLSNGITIPMTLLVPFYREQRQHQNVALLSCLCHPRLN